MAYFNLSDPANDVEPLTASANDIPVTRGLYIGVTGNISFITKAGRTVTGLPVVAGSSLPFRITRLTAGTGVYALR